MTLHVASSADSGGIHGSARAAAQSDPPEIGTILCDRYQLDRLVGRGGTALVFRGRDQVLDETVAIKLVSPDGLLQAAKVLGSRESFREEAASAMRLSHPKILRVFNYEKHPPWEFLVMEYVLGKNLAAHLRGLPDRRLTPVATVQMGIDCLDALAHSHGVGVTHNDIKPSNILITGTGSIKLCDFGLARSRGSNTNIPPGVLVGTPGFMCPERIASGKSDHRGDIYSLGATLYAIGNGRAMFGNDARAYAHHLNTPVPPSTHLPTAVHEIIHVATAKDPCSRFATAEEMRGALVGALRIVEAAAVRFSPPHERTPAVDGMPDQPTIADSASIVARRQSEHMCELATESDRAQLRSPERKSDMVAVPALILKSSYGGVFAISEILIDRCPVTNRQYRRFLDATQSFGPEHWFKNQPPQGEWEHPVVGISLADAQRYAKWRGARLPTSLEWEAAARGASGDRYPWGNHFRPDRCLGPGQDRSGTAATGSYPAGASPFGCLDMVGNTWEWTAADARMPPPHPGYTWVYGGSFRHPCHSKHGIPRTAVAVRSAYRYLGFRCACDLRTPVV